jgi:tetratricopeptide (TPR) repeat protein/Zn-dependent protease
MASPYSRRAWLVRLINWTIVFLAFVGVAFLLGLPLLAERSAEVSAFSRPAELPPEPEAPAQRDEPLVPIEELNEALQLPRVDTSPTDEHSRASLEAYREGDYERAFEEAVLSLNPAPLAQNGLYQTLTSVDARALPRSAEQPGVVEKPSGRPAIGAVDEALRPVLNEDDPQTAARLNNAAAMTILHFYTMDPSEIYQEDQGMAGAAEELAYQAVELDPSYCPALLNLTLFDGMGQTGSPTEDLRPVGFRLTGGSGLKNGFYEPENCEEPSMLYYLAQDSVTQGILVDKDIEETLELLDRLQQEHPEWAGLAHSARGDAYYWYGVLSSGESMPLARPFAAQRYFRQALEEYDAALALQPDDPAIHNGMALAYLGLGEADEAIREAETALETAPDAPRLQKTLVDAYEAKGDYAEAARLGRGLLSTEQPLPLALVPYSATSHGADLYSDLQMQSAAGGGAGAVLEDEDVIRQFEPREFPVGPPGANSGANLRTPAGMNRYQELVRHYDLLRYDLLGSDSEALNEDFERAPDPVKQSPNALLLLGTSQLLDGPEGARTPAAETQATIDAFLSRPFQGKQRPPYEPKPQGNDFFYREAGNFFREHERYEDALRVYGIWQTELERDRAGVARRAEPESLMGEAYFLNDQPEEALAAFERAEELVPQWPPYVVRQAFMHEQLEDYDRAEELYRRGLEAMQQPAEWNKNLAGPAALYPDNYQAGKHLGDVLMRQAADPGADQAGDKYAEAAEAYREVLDLPARPNFQSAAAVNNLAIALIEGGDYEGAIETMKTLTQPTVSVTETVRTLAQPSETSPWENPPTPDENNPVFRLNLGWAYELNGEPEKAAEEYLSAVRSDPTFFPALNDLGVLAANRGDLDEAKGYFKAALDLKEDYAYANHNLGAALLRGGPWNFIAAQGYLARAVREDSSLIETESEYIFDNELYFLNLSLGSNVPPDWQFVEQARRSAETVSIVALVLLAGRVIFNFAVSQTGGSAVETFFSNLERFRLGTGLLGFFVWIRNGFPRFLRLGIPASRRPWITPLALLLTVPAIVAVQYWSLLWEDSEAKPVMLGALVCLTLVSLLVHHAGHVLAVLRSRLRVREAPWPTGTALALALVALGGPAFAPLPATSVAGETEKGQGREESLAYMAGPVASTLLAVLLYALFLLSDMPLMRLGAILNLALAAASMVALPPMEGATVSERRYVRWLCWLGVFVTAFTVLIS